MQEIRFGAKLNVIPSFSDYPDYSELKRVLLECEELGYHSAWVMDHLIWGEKGPFECWVTLSALAAETEKIRLGPLVSCNSYRYPAILAKMAATFDVISRGRLEFGIGAGWLEEEYHAYGIPFPKPSIRIDQMREALHIIKKMWTEERPSYNGRHYHIREVICEPKPQQKPHPPIWIGGGGEKAIKVIAELADVSSFTPSPISGIPIGSPEEFKRKLEALRRNCEAVGRDFEKIVKSWTGDLIVAKDREALKSKIARFKSKIMSLEDYIKRSIIGTPDECIMKIEQYIELGVTYFLPSLKTLADDNRLFAQEVMSSFR